MRGSESSTMFIDFSHVMQFNNLLQKAISDEYLRFEPYLKNACKRFVMEQRPTFIADDNPNKDINIAFFNLPITKRYNFFFEMICIEQLGFFFNYGMCLYCFAFFL